MRFRVLAADFDRTLADDGRIAPETSVAVARWRAAGRRAVLVTGRRFDDLLVVCPRPEEFDLVVAENGAVLYEPASRYLETLASPPPAAFLRALTVAGVPFECGRVIVATVAPHDGAVAAAIEALALPLDVILNREAVMILPRDVSKASGLAAALARLGETMADTVAVGDAENDVRLLADAGLGVAVANAVPALLAMADLVTRAPNGAGVRELIDALLRDALRAAERRAR